MHKEDVVYIDNGYCLVTENNEILPFATTSMDFGSIMLSEISQAMRTLQGLGQVAQLVTASFQYIKVAVSVTGQGTYKNRRINQ